MMKTLIIGKNGQLAWELAKQIPEAIDTIALGHSELDITDEGAVNEAFALHNPDCVLNCAAYTAVDKAEADEKQAYLVNEQGVANLAKASKEVGSRLIHVSTDFVFDGLSTTPYRPAASTRPLSVYGASKLAGEHKVSEILPEASVIVRTAWVYSVNGNNFVKTMLRLMAEKPQLGIIFDQVGTPTWAKGLAQCIWGLVANPEVKGIVHWTDAGVASWYDFAVAIQELALEKGLLEREIPIAPIATSAYPTPAARPAFSILDKTDAEIASGITTIHWRRQLSMMLDELNI